MIQIFDYIQRKKERKKIIMLRQLIIITKTRTGFGAKRERKEMKQNCTALVY